MSAMNMKNFDNRLRALYNIDSYRLPELPEHRWIAFRDDPVGFWLRCEDTMREAIWREIEHRCRKYDLL